MHRYTGFVPPDSNWKPRRFDRLPTPAEVADYIRRREPFIIDPPRNPGAFGPGGCAGLPGTCPIEDVERDCPPLLKMMGWEKTCSWSVAQFCKMSGNKQVSLAVSSSHMGHMSTFSGSTTNTRNFTTFCKYVAASYRAVALPRVGGWVGGQDRRCSVRMVVVLRMCTCATFDVLLWCVLRDSDVGPDYLAAIQLAVSTL